MNTASTRRLLPTLSRFLGFSRSVSAVCLLAAAGFGLGGCTSPVTNIPPAAKVAPDQQTLSPGDVVKISFPGAQNLDTTQQIRRDGRLNLYMIGEVKAADMTPAEFERDLVKAYSSQLISKEIKVTVVSSSFAVFVTGAVMKPGKISSDRALTAFEAIMEAGGFAGNSANAKEVRVIRQEGGQTKTYTLNLKTILDGGQGESFYLKSYDSVYVPEKISWF
jgi:polysaccharide export outer membrane protein